MGLNPAPSPAASYISSACPSNRPMHQIQLTVMSVDTDQCTNQGNSQLHTMMFKLTFQEYWGQLVIW
jgi:hypothetical protein